MVCVALFIAAQTAFPAFAQDMDVMSVLSDSFDDVSKDADGFYDGMEYGGADRIIYCYTELYGSSGAEGYIASAKQTAQELMQSQRFVKPTDLQKCAIALAHYGECTQELINAAVYLNEDFSKQGMNAYIWGLIAVERAELPPPADAVHTRDTITARLLSLQLADGGFALTGSKADCDITSAVIYALAPQRDNEAVGLALDGAFAALKSMQLESGGFASMGTENCESTAQAIMAAASLGERKWIEESGALEALLSYRCDGGFSHISGGGASALAASQVCTALTAYVKLLSQTEVTMENEQTSEVAALESHESVDKLSGNGIKLIVTAVCAVISIALIAVWLISGRKKPWLIVAAVVLVLTGAAAWFLDISTAEEYYAQQSLTEGITVTVSADCSSAFDYINKVDAGVTLPSDGVVLRQCTVTLADGATALDALAEAARQQKVTIDYIDSWSGAYVRGIGGLYEFDLGSESGWLYSINGDTPSCAMSEYKLNSGDVLEMTYTCTLGRQD